MAIIFSQHSIIKLKQRKINHQYIIETIDNPELIRPSYNHSQELFKKFNKNYLKVIIKKIKGDILIITAHWVAKTKNKL